MSYRILVTAPELAPGGVQLLAQSGCEVLYTSQPHDAEEIEHILDAERVDAVISRTISLSAAAIESCPTLRVICKHGVGVSNIDVDAATRRGIPVFITSGANALSVAELTIGLLICAARKINFHDGEIRAGRWSRARGGMQLSGRTLGIVGYGRIGQLVAAIADALGMRVRVYDPEVRRRHTQHYPTHDRTLQELISHAEIISLHCPLNSATRHMLNRDSISGLPDGAIVINTSRGELIDEAALVDALVSGKLAAAGLDTFATEPLPVPHALRTLSNVVLTPHIGASTPEALDSVAISAASTCLAYLRGDPYDSANCINPDALARVST